jgi:hypothetical protein
MLGLIARMLEDVEQTGQWEAERETVSAFATRVHSDPVQGVLRERRDDRPPRARDTVGASLPNAGQRDRVDARDAGAEPVTQHREMSFAGVNDLWLIAACADRWEQRNRRRHADR